MWVAVALLREKEKHLRGQLEEVQKQIREVEEPAAPEQQPAQEVRTLVQQPAQEGEHQVARDRIAACLAEIGPIDTVEKAILFLEMCGFPWTLAGSEAND